MRISDWSSDVCSSDLRLLARRLGAGVERRGGRRGADRRDMDETRGAGCRRRLGDPARALMVDRGEGRLDFLVKDAEQIDHVVRLVERPPDGRVVPYVREDRADLDDGAHMTGRAACTEKERQ